MSRTCRHISEAAQPKRSRMPLRVRRWWRHYGVLTRDELRGQGASGRDWPSAKSPATGSKAGVDRCADQAARPRMPADGRLPRWARG
jgi:hypothetical protein